MRSYPGKILIVSISLLLLLSSCQTPSAVPAKTTDKSPSTGESSGPTETTVGYPAQPQNTPLEAAGTAYPIEPQITPQVWIGTAYPVETMQVPTVDANKIPTPQAGKATVTGRVRNIKANEPFHFTNIRLAEVYGDGPDASFILDTARSPAANTDQNGAFVFIDIPARKYVLIVVDPQNQDNYVIYHDAAGKAIVYDPKPDQVMDIGEISTELPQ